jgi:hypothetical protein
MTIRKTFSLPDELARALEREASAQGKPESAIVREGMAEYLATRSSSRLSEWVGKGRSAPGSRLDDDAELTAILEEKHGLRPVLRTSRRRDVETTE